MSTNRKIKRGFTLVELLVVIAILAMMVAMLLPALNKARAQARSVQCMSNLHQLSIGLNMYANDNRSTIAHGSNTFGGNSHTWNFMLDGRAVNNKVYVPGPPKNDYNIYSNTVYRCPEMDYPNMYLPLSAWVQSIYGMVDGTDKAGDPADISSSGPGFSMEAIRLARVRRSSSYPLLMDSSAFSTLNLQSSAQNDGRYRLGGTSWNPENFSRPGGGAWLNQTHGIWLAHFERANAVFADFHVEACDWKALEKMSTPNRYTGLKTGIRVWKNTAGQEVLASF
jgi:prepilin-type N-terminal cleavage/methylation domain-containing protein/prepilin-type processing-associated H-X9-DG protein